MIIVTIQDSTVKWLSPDYSLHQIMFVRSVIGLIIAITIIKLGGGLQLIKTRHLGLQLVRGGLLIIANMALFMAVAAMPIAEAIAIFFVAPLFITVLSIPILKEHVGPRRWVAVIIGLSGVGSLFKEEHIRAMKKYTDRPIVMACSNPTSKSECSAEQAYDWSDGTVIFSSGSPFDEF